MIKPQKAKHLYLEEDKKRPAFIGNDYMMLEKHDGWYGYLDFPSCVIHSRAMREIPSLVELSNKIREKGNGFRGRLIFEIMVEGLEYDSFPELNGILNRKYEQADDVYLRVHDFLPGFKCDIQALIRYNFAKEIVERLNMQEVKMSPVLGISDDNSVWQDTAEEMWTRGAEGLILKRIDAHYSPEKRNADLMKIKEEVTVDLLVEGMIEGEGKYQGTLGALLLRDKAGKQHKVSGMTDAQRDSWFNNPSEIVGKVVEVKAMKKLKDGSYREPRFKAIRYDKVAQEID